MIEKVSWETPEWWNWQTCWTQNPVVAIPCGFDPRHRHQKRTHLCRRQRWVLFNEINPFRDLWNNASHYEIADAMKYAAAYEGFILFHILALDKIFHNRKIISYCIAIFHWICYNIFGDRYEGEQTCWLVNGFCC